MQDELSEAFTSAAGANVRVVVLQGAGEAFCAGLDIEVLREVADRSPEQHRTEAARTARMFRSLWECDVPTLALVHGPAIAGGTGLATLCDFTLASPQARFGYTEARIGFVPALVSAYLQVQVGAKAAQRLLLSARLFGPEEAFRLQLVSEIVEREHLRTRAAELMAELLRNSPESMRATKRLLRAQRERWLDAALGHAAEANARSRETADFREGVTAFLEKRTPVWNL